VPSLSPSLEQLSFSQLERIDSRLTSSRRSILAILENAAQPMTVTEISRKTNDLPQSSIYRNLSVLIEAGLVKRIIGDHDFAFFELDDRVLGHHHHLRCTSCGTVIDIELPKNVEDQLHKLGSTIGRKHHFTDVHHQLEFTGLCDKCQ
jgi:Fe2+ or Zn2+ uptake regulation protein